LAGLGDWGETWSFQPDISFAGLGNAGDEWGLVPSEDANHIAKRGNQHLGHFATTVIARTEVELADFVLADCGLFQFVVPNAFVFGQQCPAFVTDKGKPHRVFRSWSKVLSVALMLYAMLSKGIQDGPAVVKIFVEIKNEVFRQR